MDAIRVIKAWTESEAKKDQDILAAAVNEQPRWPWFTTGEFTGRLAEASERRTHRDLRRRAPTQGRGRFRSRGAISPQ